MHRQEVGMTIVKKCDLMTKLEVDTAIICGGKCVEKAWGSEHVLNLMCIDESERLCERCLGASKQGHMLQTKKFNLRSEPRVLCWLTPCLEIKRLFSYSVQIGLKFRLSCDIE